MARTPIKIPTTPKKPTPSEKIAAAAEAVAAAQVIERRTINTSALIASQAGEVRQPTQSGEKVTVMIPKAFTLTLEDHTQVKYGAGTDEMPIEHAEHWYSKAMGVEIYRKKKPTTVE